MTRKRAPPPLSNILAVGETPEDGEEKSDFGEMFSGCWLCKEEQMNRIALRKRYERSYRLWNVVRRPAQIRRCGWVRRSLQSKTLFVASARKTVKAFVAREMV